MPWNPFIRRPIGGLFGTRQLDWPSPSDSLGDFVKSKDNFHLWKAKGPSRKCLDELRRDIFKYLQNCGYEKPSSAILGFTLHMTGESAETAGPLLILKSNDLAVGQKVLSMIDESGLVRADGRLAIGEEYNLRRLGKENIDPDQRPASVTSSLSGAITLSGNKIFTLPPTETTSSTHVATVGGFVRHCGDVYAFTACHPFHLLDGSQTSDQAALGQQKNVCTASPGDSIASSDLDYALLRLENLHTQPVSTAAERQVASKAPPSIHGMLPDPENGEISVTSNTASGGHMTGLMDGMPSPVYLPNNNKPRDLFEVQFDAPLEQGDCGSWVLDAETRALYGHIVAGCEQEGLAYIMPANDVVADVINRLRQLTPSKSDVVFEPVLKQESNEASRKESTLSDPSIEDENLVDATEESRTALDQSEQTGKAMSSCSPLHLQSVPCSCEAVRSRSHWPKEFTTRRTDIDLASENVPYVDKLAELGYQGNLVHGFMLDLESPNFGGSAGGMVNDFCKDVDISSLSHQQSDPVAWLDERSFEGGPRKYRGPLTALDLYNELKRPVR